MPSYFPFPIMRFLIPIVLMRRWWELEKNKNYPHSITAAVRICIQVFVPIIEKKVSALTLRHGSWSKNNYPEMANKLLSLLSLVLNCSHHSGTATLQAQRRNLYQTYYDFMYRLELLGTNMEWHQFQTFAAYNIKNVKFYGLLHLTCLKCQHRETQQQCLLS